VALSGSIVLYCIPLLYKLTDRNILHCGIRRIEAVLRAQQQHVMN